MTVQTRKLTGAASSLHCILSIHDFHRKAIREESQGVEELYISKLSQLDRLFVFARYRSSELVAAREAGFWCIDIEEREQNDEGREIGDDRDALHFIATDRNGNQTGRLSIIVA